MLTKVAPYRATVSQSELDAETGIGPVKLSLSPKSTRLTIGSQIWTIADDHLVIASQGKGKRKPKKRSIGLGDAGLYVARAWPTNEVSLWLERKSGVVQRLLGLPPQSGMTKLQNALVGYGRGARASELGNGQNRVLVLQFPEKLVVYARKVFREKPRWIVELRQDGSLALPGRPKEKVICMDRGMEVIASGDRINFCHPDGEQVAGIFLPWIGDADRVELTRRFRALIAATRRR